MRRKLIIFVIIAVIGYFLYSHFFGAGHNAGAAGGAPPVSVATVIERDVRQWHEFSGRLVAIDSVDIRPQVTGRISEIHFKERQWVEKDAPLFTIDQRPYAAALEAARARAVFAAAELERAKTLSNDKAIPKRDYDQRRNDSEVAKADLATSQINYDYTIVKAPVAGHVSRAELTVGNVVDAGSNAPVLTSIVSDKPIYADFEIDEQTFLHYLQAVGSDREKLNNIPVTLELSGDSAKPFEGHVQSFDNQLNVRSGTIRVRAVFSNDDEKLIPGLFARVKIADADARKALLIADGAVGTDQNKKFVLVVGDDNKAEHREVKLDGMADGLRIVNEGLKPGEKIIVSGTQRVMMPGQPVTPDVVNMDGTPLGEASGSGLQDTGKKKDDAKPESKP